MEKCYEQCISEEWGESHDPNARLKVFAEVAGGQYAQHLRAAECGQYGCGSVQSGGIAENVYA